MSWLTSWDEIVFSSGASFKRISFCEMRCLIFTVDTHGFHIEYFTHIDSKRIHSCIARNDHSLNKSYIGKP